MNNSSRQLFIVAAIVIVLFLVSSAIQGGSKSSDKPSIVGHWMSEEVEVRPGQNGSSLYLRRDFNTTTNSSVAQLQFYNDQEGDSPTLKIEIEGPYEILGASSDVPGAFNANFHFEQAKVTPQNDALVNLLNGAEKGTCGNETWVLNEEQDVTATGCSPIGIDLKNKNTEYDIVKVEDNKLYYGARPTDGSGLDTPEKRPKALQVPLDRSE